MELSEYFKGVIDTSVSPIVICDLDYRIIYLNSEAVRRYQENRPNSMIGTSLRILFNEEILTKIDMSVEWFKEEINNNKVFAYHSDHENKDVYIRAIRDSEKRLIGFFSYHEFRDPETGKEYDLE